MKTIVLVSLILVTSALESKLAEPCDPEECLLPDCRCSTTEIPGGLQARDTPQFVTVTFGDAVNVINIQTYRELLYNRFNKNGCRSGATYIINHEYNNYELVNELYNQGFEIGLNSISHQTPPVYWAEASYDVLAQELGDQKLQMSHFANIPESSIKGIRMPFLQLSGNTSFEIIRDYNLTYDLSWPTISHINPGLWPYTLHYASTQDCLSPPCPTASIEDAWVFPTVSWLDLNGVPCTTVDSCYWVPDRTDEQAWFEFILNNFETQYLGNRAPFGLSVQEWYLSSYPAVRSAIIRFLDLVNNLEDVFLVNAGDVIDWVKNPVTLEEYVNKPCANVEPTTCQATTCSLSASHNDNLYWMTVCSICPDVYPWVGNPLGEAPDSSSNESEEDILVNYTE